MADKHQDGEDAYSKHHHADDHHKEAGHSKEGHAAYDAHEHGHQHADSHHGLSFDDRVLLKTRELIQPFLSSHGHHHHHHHHHHVEYKAPKELTEPLALYSLKKLAALDHSMPAADVRLLNPVKPGVLSWLVIMGMSGLIGAWGAYVFRTSGVRGFFGKGGLVFAGLLAGLWLDCRIMDEMRELLVRNKRKQLAEAYRRKYGDAYLLSVLNPAFKLAHH